MARHLARGHGSRDPIGARRSDTEGARKPPFPVLSTSLSFESEVDHEVGVRAVCLVDDLSQGRFTQLEERLSVGVALGEDFASSFSGSPVLLLPGTHGCERTTRLFEFSRQRYKRPGLHF